MRTLALLHDVMTTAQAMEPHQIKQEITALQARFDALRGYL